MAEESVVILGIRIQNATKAEATELFEDLIRGREAAHAIFLVNAHTLNLARENGRFREVLQKAYRVYGDGTGVRWAARWRRVRMRDNLVGTDLVPYCFERTAIRGHRYFLLGATADTISRAADYARTRFPGWVCAGFQHGFFGQDELDSVIAEINESGADLLLVGMGNPTQETWIADNLGALRVPVCIGVGGLFDHWGGNLKRAPAWVRALGYEWVQLLLQQPKKWRRYLLGNPKFIWSMVRDCKADLRLLAVRAHRDDRRGLS